MLDKFALALILDRFLVETNFCECDAATLLHWCKWLDRQIPDEEQFLLIVREWGIAEAILDCTIAQIRQGESPAQRPATSQAPQ